MWHCSLRYVSTEVTRERAFSTPLKWKQQFPSKHSYPSRILSCSSSDLYSGGARFKPWHWYQLCWSRFLVVLCWYETSVNVAWAVTHQSKTASQITGNFPHKIILSFVPIIRLISNKISIKCFRLALHTVMQSICYCPLDWSSGLPPNNRCSSQGHTAIFRFSGNKLAEFLSQWSRDVRH
jgi:hypothetical protein